LLFDRNSSIKCTSLPRGHHGFWEETTAPAFNIRKPLCCAHPSRADMIRFDREGSTIPSTNFDTTFLFTRIKHLPRLSIQVSYRKGFHVGQYVGVRD
jgi:hypothetical protein